MRFAKHRSRRQHGRRGRLLFNKFRFSPWQRSLFLLPPEYQRKEASASREQILQQTCVVKSILYGIFLYKYEYYIKRFSCVHVNELFALFLDVIVYF